MPDESEFPTTGKAKRYVFTDRQGDKLMSGRPIFLCMIDSNRPADKVTNTNVKFEHHAQKKPTFGIDTALHTVRFWTTDSEMVFQDRSRGLLLLLYGEIYNTAADDKLQWIAREYNNNGLEFAQMLNGSFLIILVDSQKDRIAVITDRVNSRRAYARTYEGSRWLSNCLYSLPLANAKLDNTGIAWYLVNKSVFHNRTLFEDVRILERASIHEIDSEKMSRRQYWNYQFDNAYDGMGKSRLKAELSEILVESMRKRTSDGSNLFLSLSAGYDATTILGIMRFKLKLEGVQCFSYFRSSKPSKNADAYLSHEMAEIAGYNHRMLQGYHGDIINWINQNGSIGNGTSPSGEIDAMTELFDAANKNQKCKVFIGDECFGWLDRALETPKDVLSVLYIYDRSSALLLSELTDAGTSLPMLQAMEADQESIVSKHAEAKNIHDLKDMLYLDQRLSNYILPNKEYFIGNFASVVNPFLDNDILDFMMKIPVPLRLDKCLFRETVTDMFPQLFSIERAEHAEFVKDWGKEFTRCRAEIASWLNSQRSILDDIIPPDKIIKFMENELSPKTSLITKIGSKVKANLIGLDVLGKKKAIPEAPKVPQLSRDELLRRILVLRSFLNHSVDRQQGI